ncbi:MAG: sulfotransferase [Acidobacteria bacterium]|nr:sulfotransferase [Acidobacteriota bacterium]
MKQIVYILGSGRSGSTLLDIMLGNAEGVFSCGELRRFSLHGGLSRPNEQRVESIQFWKKVSNGLDKILPELDRTNLKKLCHEIEYHSRFVTPWQLTQDKIENYGRYVNALMDLIFEESGANWIVDSSKYPGRLLALLKVSKYPVSVVYLTRHPVGVVQSFGRNDVEQPGKGFWAVNYYYGVNGLLCRIAYHRVSPDRRLKMRYENLIHKPEQTLSAIGKKFGMNLETSVSIAAAGKPFQVGHLVDGNRIRLENEILLRSDEQIFNWDMKSMLTRVLNCIWY